MVRVNDEYNLLPSEHHEDQSYMLWSRIEPLAALSTVTRLSKHTDSLLFQLALFLS